MRVFDRKKDIINRGGFKIFSAELENIIAGLEGVLERAIVGRDDSVLGQRVHAVVVVPHGSPLGVSDIHDFGSGKLADYKVPEAIDFRRTALPEMRTASAEGRAK